MIRARFLLGGAVLGAATAALVLPGAASAQTESRLSADASATAGYSSNPLTIQNAQNTGQGGTGAPVITLDISPRYQLVTARSTFTVSADANLQQYLRRYGSSNGYSAALDYVGRPSQRLTTHARLEGSSVVLGSSNSYLPFTTGAGLGSTGVTDVTTIDTGTATVVPVPVSTVATPISYTDVGLYGLRNRRDLGRASGDIGLTLSAQDSLTVAAFGELSRYHDSNVSTVAGIGLNDYEGYGGSAGYQRRLSGRLSVGLRGSAASYTYHINDTDSRVYSIQATANGQLNERWTADGSLGVSFVNGNSVRSTRSTSLSGNIDLCRRGPLTVLCVQAGRQVSPTGLAGSQYATTAGLSWTRRLDERQNLSLSANYSHVGSGDTRLLPGGTTLQNDYAQVVANYNRRLGPRLRFVALANYRQLFGGTYGQAKDVGGQIGLSYRIGDRR